MLISTLVEELDRSNISWAAKTNIKAEVHSYQPILSEVNYLPNIVYIGSVSELPISAPDNINFICVTDDVTMKISNLQNCNVILTDGDILTLIKAVSLHFSTEQRLYSDMHKLSKILNSDNCLDLLVETAYEMLGNPIIIVDSSYKILAMNKETVEVRPDLEVQRELGYMTNKNIEDMKQAGLYEKARKSHYPYYSKEPIANFGWITALVYVHNIEAAQIGVMECNHEFTHYDYELINYLCKLISLELQKSSFYQQNRSLMHSVFLSELLQGRIKNTQTAFVRAQQLGWKIPEHMALLTVFDFNSGAFDQRALLICKQVQDILPGSRWVIYKGRLVFLVPFLNKDSEPIANESALKEYLATNQLIASVSQRFSDITELSGFYNQCDIAYDLGILLNPESKLHFYSDYLLHHIGITIANNNNLHDFYHPKVMEIAEYDKKTNGELLNTLEAYLTYVDNPAEASQKMNIHKNTLFYRVNKIKELFGLDLNNGFERAKILLTLSFMKLK